MIKLIWKRLLSKLGIVNFSLKLAEFIVRNYSFSVEIPFEKWANQIIKELQKVADDGQLSNEESAEFIAFIRTLVKHNAYANFALRIAESILGDIEYSHSIPYEGWANDIIDQLQEASDDGKITNNEVADFIKFIREARN